MCQRKKFANWSIFDEVMTKTFFSDSCILLFSGIDRNRGDRNGLDFSSHMYISHSQSHNFRSNLSHVFVDLERVLNLSFCIVATRLSNGAPFAGRTVKVNSRSRNRDDGGYV